MRSSTPTAPPSATRGRLISKVPAPPCTFRDTALCNGQSVFVTARLSIRQPTALSLLSDAMRKVSLMFCPPLFGPSFAIVLLYPPDFPLHPMRPTIGL